MNRRVIYGHLVNAEPYYSSPLLTESESRLRESAKLASRYCRATFTHHNFTARDTDDVGFPHDGGHCDSRIPVKRTRPPNCDIARTHVESVCLRLACGAVLNLTRTPTSSLLMRLAIFISMRLNRRGGVGLAGQGVAWISQCAEAGRD